MKLLLIGFLLVNALLLATCKENKYAVKLTSCTKDKDGNQYCEKKDEYEEGDDEPTFYSDDEEGEEEENKEIDPSKWEGKKPLFQWDPVKVGHEQQVELTPLEIRTLKTVAMKPKAFVIDDFLTHEECDHVIKKAQESGLHESQLHIDPETRKSKEYTNGHANSAVGVFRQWDRNGDGEITVEEVKRMAEKNVKLYLNETDIAEMFSILKMNELEDGVITREEFANMNTAGVGQYMTLLREENPRFRDRFSDQIWLRQGETSDYTMQEIRDKVWRLTRLPRYIIDGGEALQVLRYQPYGHYHAHFDGQDKAAHPDKKMCCHMDLDASPETCRICRFITIVYYLNDVEEGGETAFPVADKEDYDHETFRKREKDDMYNLSKFCHNSTLVVKPKKGRAVMWYNHHMDKHGWLGDMDYWSLHGGCDIIKGTKWMANNWLTAPSADLAHLDSLYLHYDAPGAH